MTKIKKNLFTIGLIICLCSNIEAQQNDWTSLEHVFGKKGTSQGNMFKITFPRSDLHVSLDDVPIQPGLALTSWVAFMDMHDQTMIMGDLVLLEQEIPAVMSTLVKMGIKITALHNHLLREKPTVMYMHIGATGEPKKLAEEIKEVLSKTSTPMTSPQLPPKPTASPDWKSVQSIIGYTGKENGTLLQFSIPRAETLYETGMEVPPFMGMATAINFQSIGNNAAITGDFVLLANEVNPTLKALSDHGIMVTAVHNHMLNETPRLFFMHFWAVNDPEKLALGIRAALDQTHSKK